MLRGWEVAIVWAKGAGAQAPPDPPTHLPACAWYPADGASDVARIQLQIKNYLNLTFLFILFRTQWT